MSDRLFDGRPFRILTIVDRHTREALATSARTDIGAVQVTGKPDRIARIRGGPRGVRLEDGPEFAARPLDRRVYLNRVEPGFSRPGKPGDDARIEAFNRRLRQDGLNASGFLSMADPRQRIDDRRIDLDGHRPHSGPGNLTPADPAARAKPARKAA